MKYYKSGSHLFYRIRENGYSFSLESIWFIPEAWMWWRRPWWTSLNIGGHNFSSLGSNEYHILETSNLASKPLWNSFRRNVVMWASGASGGQWWSSLAQNHRGACSYRSHHSCLHRLVTYSWCKRVWMSRNRYFVVISDRSSHSFVSRGRYLEFMLSFLCCYTRDHFRVDLFTSGIISRP